MADTAKPDDKAILRKGAEAAIRPHRSIADLKAAVRKAMEQAKAEAEDEKQ